MDKTYYVRVPFAGCVSMEIEASSEEEAKEKALVADFRLYLDDETGYGVELEEFDTFRHLCRGNVVYAPLWEIDIEEV